MHLNIRCDGKSKKICKFFLERPNNVQSKQCHELAACPIVPRHDSRRVPKPAMVMAGYTLACPATQAPRHQYTPPPCMTGSCVFAPPCMGAGQNGLDLQILSKQGQICIFFFKFRLKIKKIHLRWNQLPN